MGDNTYNPDASRDRIAKVQERLLGEWPDPTEVELSDPRFDAIWGVIKGWGINVPHVYPGYSGVTGNHVVAILHALDLLGTE